jgi:hypothetical protein
MLDASTERELKDRLDLIERMILEGRRTTESWGWTFVLWGVVFYVAFAWSTWGHGAWAWPITVSVGVILTILIASLKSRHAARTAVGKTIAAIWIALTVSFCILLPALSASGRLADLHIFMAVVSAILGLANGASALILRWNVQLACAIVWWIAAIATCFGSDVQSTTVFLGSIFLCQIVFGVYGMIAGAQQRKRHGLVHA